MKTPSLLVVAAILVISLQRHCESATPASTVLYYTAFVPMREQRGVLTYPDGDGPRAPILSPEAQEKIETERQAREQAAVLKHRREQTSIANRLLEIFAATTTIELLSLNPDPRLVSLTNSGGLPSYTSNDYHAGGFKITGRAQTASVLEIGELVAGLRMGFKDSTGESCDCAFEPRYSLRFAANGRNYLAVVGFESQRAYLCEIGNSANRADLLIARTPEREFDAIFAKHGLKKTP
jgi:hypothetical protein